MKKKRKKSPPGRYYRKSQNNNQKLWIPVLTCLCLIVGVWAAVSLLLSDKSANEAHPFSAESTGPVNITIETTAECIYETAQMTTIAATQAPLTTAAEDTEEYPPALYMYDYILQKYLDAIAEKWDFIRCEEEEISYLTAFLTASEELGYQLLDLDGNGNDELIISDGTVIYDLYTLTDSGPERILTGGERNSYFLCEDHIISNRGANSAFSSVYHFYRLEGQLLTAVQSVLFDAEADTASDWFAYEIADDPNSLVPISEDAANAVIDSYRTVLIDILPLTQKP